MDSLKLIWHKITHWEYWPIWLIHYPMAPVWLYYSIKARSLFFFNAANPGMKNGGMAMISKMDIYNMIPAQFIPKTLYIKKDEAPELALDELGFDNIIEIDADGNPKKPAVEPVKTDIKN